jgi:hypothetical protein
VVPAMRAMSWMDQSMRGSSRASGCASVRALSR